MADSPSFSHPSLFNIHKYPQTRRYMTLVVPKACYSTRYIRILWNPKANYRIHEPITGPCPESDESFPYCYCVPLIFLFNFFPSSKLRSLKVFHLGCWPFRASNQAVGWANLLLRRLQNADLRCGRQRTGSACSRLQSCSPCENSSDYSFLIIDNEFIFHKSWYWARKFHRRFSKKSSVGMFVSSYLRNVSWFAFTVADPIIAYAAAYDSSIFTHPDSRYIRMSVSESIASDPHLPGEEEKYMFGCKPSERVCVYASSCL